MKTTSEMRLECIRLASMLATSKQIPPKDVVKIAEEYLTWIDGDRAPSRPPAFGTGRVKIDADRRVF